MNEPLFNIIIKEYRAVFNANIDINGVTVISGDNGSGKSTISLLAFQYFNSSIHLNELLDNRVHQLFTVPLHLIRGFLNDLSTTITDDSLNITIELIKQYDIKWNKTEVSIYDIKNNIQEIIVNTIDIYTEYEDLINNNNDLSKKTIRYSNLLISLVPILNEVNLTDSNKRLDSILMELRDFIDSEFDKLITPNHYSAALLNSQINLYENKSIPKFIEFKEYGVPLYSFPNANETIKVQSIDTVFYIDSPLMLEKDISKLELKHYWRHLRDELKNSSNNKSINEIDNLFHNRIQIQNIEHQIAFEETFNYIRTDGKIFNLSESATGIKAFAIINLLYKKGLLTKKTLLILDEPEVHLHPKWVVEYARLVILLNKYLGVKFLIASHHPEFVSAIKFIGEKEKIETKLNFYLAREKKEKQNQYEFISNGYEIDEIFNSFNKSFDLIDDYGSNEI